jgi:hypothetical protein
MKKWVLLIALLAGCPQAHAKPTKAQPVDCGLEIANLDSVLKPGGTLVFGDIHGTVEIPRFVAAAACHSARRGPTVVGFEIDADPRLNAFLRSNGGDQAKRTFLAGTFWADPFQDGRRSVAAFELIDHLRRWRQTGLPIDVLFFSAHKTAERTRDQLMGEIIAAERKQRPGASFLLMMGNLHARKDSALMKQLSSSIALDVRHHSGTAWVCRTGSPDSCGPIVIPRSEGEADRSGIDLTPPLDRSFDGYYDVVSFTASPPAAFPEKTEAFEAKMQVLMSSVPKP